MASLVRLHTRKTIKSFAFIEPTEDEREADSSAKDFTPQADLLHRVEVLKRMQRKPRFLRKATRQRSASSFFVFTSPSPAAVGRRC